MSFRTLSHTNGATRGIRASNQTQMAKSLVSVALILACTSLATAQTPQNAASEKLQAISEAISRVKLDETENAAKSGDAAAQFLLGRHLIASDETEALKWITSAFDQQLPEAIEFMAMCYELGKLVQKDTKKAASLYLQAAKLEQPMSQFIVANYYKDGLFDVPKDYQQFQSWLRKSAGNGLAKAQSDLGVLLYFGDEGIEKNVQQAVHWLELASNQDDSNARALLGPHRWRESFGIKDEKIAFETMDKAADNIILAAHEDHKAALESFAIIYFLSAYNMEDDIKPHHLRELKWHGRRAKAGCHYSKVSLMHSWVTQKTNGELSKPGLRWLTEDLASNHYQEFIRTAPKESFLLSFKSVSFISDSYKNEREARLREDLRRGDRSNVNNPFDEEMFAKFELAALAIDKAYQAAETIGRFK